MPSLGKWGDTLDKRVKTGFPYMFFTDNANRGMPQWYKDQGRSILHSNLDQLLGKRISLRKI